MQSTATLHQQIDALKKGHKVLEDENRLLREQLNLLKAKLFGRNTEKSSGLPQDQLQQELFALDDDEEMDDQPEEEEGETQAVTIKRKKRGARKPIPDWFPRNEVIHDIPEEERICGCGHPLDKIGEETSEQIEWVPARAEVTRTIRVKRACRACEGLETEGGTVKIPPVPPQMLPKCLAGPGLLAEVLINKFADGLPFYRQEKRFARAGLDISRTSMANWSMKVADRCAELIEILQDEAIQSNYIQIDETTFQVMNEEGRKNQTKSYMWVIRGAPPGPRIVLYQYHPTRHAAFVQDLLKDYEGFVQTDGYKGYDFLDFDPKIVHLGCWAHARRKFTDVAKSAKPRKGKKTRRKAYAEIALDFIGQLYGLEREADNQGLDVEARLLKRQQEGKPILAAFKDWLDELAPKAMTGSLLGKAIAYTLGQWPRLLPYLDTGFCAPDNNGVENTIRPFVLGRKNWILSGSPKGAKASATMYTLIETAKANGWDPFAYLRFLFNHLPLATTREEKRLLLPTVAKPVSPSPSEGGA
jgi:transposase